jgi:uncharacterized PurR-regulated membrane protein YhhQ (DUF165 family)
MVGMVICIIAGKKHAWVVQVSYAATVVACLATAAKISPIVPDVFVSVAIGLYSMTFLLTDFLGEVFIFAIALSIYVPAAPFWENQEAFVRVLGTAPRIMVASITALVAAQLLDVTVFDWLKKKMSGRLLVIRNNVSTILGQTTDSVVFYTIAFWGVVPNLLELLAVTCLVKYLIAAADTPFLYLARHVANRGISIQFRRATQDQEAGKHKAVQG